LRVSYKQEDIDNLEKAFNLMPRWYSQFPLDSRKLGGENDLTKDARILKLSDNFPLAGKRVLELASMEGAHTYLLHLLGCREVMGVEGRTWNFLKACLVKNIFDIDNCKFILADLRARTFDDLGRFDLCLCIGILYHVMNPVFIMKNIGRVTNHVFIWSHYATDHFPSGPEKELYDSDLRRTYRGRIAYEVDLDHPLSGLGETSLWLFREDFLNMLWDLEFADVKILDEGEMYDVKARHFLILASKRNPY